jgi:hypothetical protein
MVEALPLGEDVPSCDAADAERDRAEFVLLRAKLARYVNEAEHFTP